MSSKISVVMKSVQLQGKSIQPSKVVCLGRNYVEHIAELNNEVPDEMVVFIKPNSAISHEIEITADEDIHYEGELVFLVSQGRLVAVGFGLDLTKRSLQTRLKQKGLPWERAKSFDGAAVLSHFVDIDDVSDLSLQLSVNGELRQQGHCRQMMYSPSEIMQELSTFLTLEDGDLIMTGTPKGVGKIQAGELFTAKVLAGEQLLLEVQWQVK